ncbi:MAG TPA: thioredoxin-disulfide reductase [Epulopiscium sp.]|nr:thioredoxin-disulfide reductase [Candidatus Epulonipiscium sp.]
MNDIIIIGGGPAGLTAALYGGRAALKTLLIEKAFQGGQMVTTTEIDNYPGMMGVTGPDLSNAMFEQAKQFGTQVEFAEVLGIEVEDGMKRVITSSGTHQSKVVILSLGTVPRKLGLKNEEALTGRGISYCANCDGGFFKDKVVAIIGGGDTAVEDALYLSRIAKKVYLIHRRDSLRAVSYLQAKLFNSDVEIMWDHEVTKLYSESTLTGIEITNNKEHTSRDIDVDGIFVAVGSLPTTDLVKDLVELNEDGYIITNENCLTNVDGIFAVGDVREKDLRQIVTAVADGAISVYQAQTYLFKN